MMSAALLEQDFGSESEDDNFNPAPADESDNEAGGDSDTEPNSKPITNSTDRGRRSSAENTGRVKSPEHEPNVEDEDEGDDVNGVGDQEDEDDDEDEDEEEDEDDAITVRCSVPVTRTSLTHVVGTPSQEDPPRPA